MEGQKHAIGARGLRRDPRGIVVQDVSQSTMEEARGESQSGRRCHRSVCRMKAATRRRYTTGAAAPPAMMMMPSSSHPTFDQNEKKEFQENPTQSFSTREGT